MKAIFIFPLIICVQPLVDSFAQKPTRASVLFLFMFCLIKKSMGWHSRYLSANQCSALNSSWEKNNLVSIMVCSTAVECFWGIQMSRKTKTNYIFDLVWLENVTHVHVTSSRPSCITGHSSTLNVLIKTEQCLVRNANHQPSHHSSDSSDDKFGWTLQNVTVQRWRSTNAALQSLLSHHV